jgi:hypothetical protein
MTPMKNQTARTASAIALIAAIIFYRLLIGFEPGKMPWLENFAPVAAIALCGGIYLPRRLAFVAPLGGLLVSDVFLNAHYGYPLFSPQMISRYLALAAIVAIGFAIRNRPRLATALPASAGGSLLFYVVTNTASWLGEPAYAKSAAGWLQALTTGLPGYEPTWMFFRSTLVSDLLFTGLFVFCMAATREREAAPVLVGSKA